MTPYFKADQLKAMHQRMAESRADAELVAAAGDLDHEQIAHALHLAIQDGTVVETENDDGTSTVERADGALLDLDVLVGQYAAADLDDEDAE